MTRVRARLVLPGLLLCGLVAGCGRPAPSRVALESPLERQVVQRGADDKGSVAVAGTVSEDVEAVELQAALAGGGSTPWEAVGLAAAADGRRRFAATLRLPAGGWHALWARTRPEGTPTRIVERLGVGEVFVAAGQSNSTNSGEPFPLVPDDRVSAFDGARWSLARDPMPGVQDRSTGGSPWPLFGQRLAGTLDMPVGIACVGHGGSSVDDWQPEGRLFPALRERVRTLGRIRAVLWHQGETDALRGMPGAEYAAKFRRLQAALAEGAEAPPPWIVARASFQPRTPEAAMRAIRGAQESLWRDGDALPGPSTDELQGLLRARDRVHFSAAGQQAHGELWFAQVWAALHPSGTSP